MYSDQPGFFSFFYVINQNGIHFENPHTKDKFGVGFFLT